MAQVPATRPKRARKVLTAQDVRARLDARFTTMDGIRISWWKHWQELADYILPRRYRWLISTDQWNRGSPINQRIINSTATLAARNCASGIMSGTTSPARPWFRLAVGDDKAADDIEVKQWLEECTKRMMRVMATSNYYQAKAMQYLDLVVFGTAPMIMYEDPKTTIRCFNPCAGEYYVALGKNLDVNTLARKYTMTNAQLEEEFGWDALPLPIQQQLENNQLENEQVVRHIIEPNPGHEEAARERGLDELGIARMFKYRELYWLESGSNAEKVFLRVAGFNDQPFSCPRWDVTGNDAYGRSPGMDALGDAKQLQLEEKRKAQAIDKQVNPPMVADPAMKNEPASLLPGAINYVAAGPNGAGFRPAYQVNPQINELKDDIAKVENRIEKIFYNDLFLMISQLDTVRSATEIDARREEKLIMLGPVLERNEVEGLTPDIRRLFNIMARRGMLPPPPEAITSGVAKLDIAYVSLLADLQRASMATAIERVWAFAGRLGAAQPAALDNLDADQSIKEYASLLRLPPQILTTKATRDQLRKARAQQQAQEQQQQQAAVAVEGAKTLSETDVGGGQNALSMMINGGGAGVMQ